MDNVVIRLKKGQAVIENIFNQLKKDIKYALNSKSRDLAYQAYGEVKMAWRLEAITDEQFYELNEMVIVNGINKPSAGLE